MQDLNPIHPNAFIIKSSFFPVFMLQMLTTDTELFIEQLTKLLCTQEFSQNTIMALDLQKVPADSKIDFMPIKQALLAKTLCLIGVIGGSEQQKILAMNCGLYLLTVPNRTKGRIERNEQLKHLSAEIITTTIHSGQKIYAKNRDLICTAAVNRGAEVISDGNIHIYGKLSGRALAGANGDKNASIFCVNFDAELVSIAGFYNAGINMHIPSATPVQIQLINEELKARSLNTTASGA